MAAAVPAGISSRGDSSRRRADHLPPLPRAGAPKSTTRASSERRSEASGGAPRHADDAEGMGKQVFPAEGAMSGRGGHYRRRSSSSCGSSAAPLAHSHPASPPVSSRGGRNGRKTHGGDDASSFIALRMDKGPGARDAISEWRLPKVNEEEDEVGDAKDWHTSQIPSGARDAISEWRLPKVSEEEDEVGDVKDWHTSQIPPGARDAISEWRLPKVSEEEDEVGDWKDWHTSHMSSDAKGNFESDGSHEQWRAQDFLYGYSKFSKGENWFEKPKKPAPAHEGRYHRAEGIGPSHLREKIKITLKKPKPPSIQGSFFDQYSSSTNTQGSSEKSDAGKKNFCKGDDEGPHPPPFYKCEACKRRTAFFILQCCGLVICNSCGCNCSTPGKQLHTKLPEVRIEGSDLFLWKSYPFPSSGSMLYKAKRTGDKVQYYFAPLTQLTDTLSPWVHTTVYTFEQKGMKEKRIEIIEESVRRTALH